MVTLASQCAHSVRVPEENGPADESVQIISTALMLIMQTARFVEQKCRDDPNLGSLSLAILAKSKRNSVSPIQEFRLHGPKLRVPIAPLTEGSGQDEIGSHEDGVNEDLQNKDVHPARGSMRSEGAPNTGNTSPSTQITPPGVRISPSESGGGGPMSRADENFKLPAAVTKLPKQMKRTAQDILEIEQDSTAKCLSLLLDASGITSHPSCYRYRKLSHVPAPVLKMVIRNMMEKYKAQVKTSGKDVKYSSLLPTELRGRRVEYTSPVLVRKGPSCYFSNSVSEAVLTVKKPDRNKKETHFAMFSALIQIDPGGICFKELHALAEEGIRLSGCDRKPGIPCGGPQSCNELDVVPVTHFYNEKGKRVSSGEVYPSISYLLGEPVPRDTVVVRFDSSSSRESTEKDNFLRLWKIELVSRHYLLDAFGNTVDSAVVAVRNSHHQENSSRSPLSNLDISESAVVCNITVDDKHKADPLCFLRVTQIWIHFSARGLQ